MLYSLLLFFFLRNFYPLSFVFFAYNQPYLLSFSGKNINYALCIVYEHHGRKSEMLSQGVYNVKSNIQASTVVQVAIWYPVVSSLACFRDRPVHLAFEELEASHAEFAVDFVLQQLNLCPDKFFSQIKLLFKLLIFRSQLPFLDRKSTRLNSSH